MNHIVGRINNFLAVTRVLISLGIAVASFIFVACGGLEILTSITLGWDVFCLSLIVLSWISFFTLSESQVRQQAQRQDESRYIIFTIVLLSILVSLAGILLLMRSSNESLIREAVHRGISLLGVALSWILLHTVFTLHYAHLYYFDDGSKSSEKHVCGLDFPQDDTPDYLDFAYFAFVVGMTFQVSDVEVTTKKVRRFVLLHGFISFVFNTIIVALTISIISNLGK